MPNLLQCKQNKVNYSTDIQTQRQTIISLLEQMINFIHDGKRLSHGTSRILADLNEETINYFKSTETLLKKNECSKLTSYQREHRLFLAEFKHLFRTLKKNPINPDLKDLRALKSWFVTHANCGPCKH